jgi:hypothetical protein
LSNNTNYTVTVTTNVKDLAGNNLASQSLTTFQTVAAVDNTSPTIVSRDPTNGATGIAINFSPTITFSEPMNPSTITSSTITLTPTAGGAAIPATVTYDAGLNKATIDPTSDLANNTSYTLTVTTGAKDVAGNSVVATGAQPLTSTFTTIVDTIAPTVISRTPAGNNPTNVPRNTTVTFTFSENMKPSTINGTTVTLSVTVGGAPVTGLVSYDVATKTATFTPSANLAASTQYTATVTTGATDTADNPLTGNFNFNFTTGTTPP